MRCTPSHTPAHVGRPKTQAQPGCRWSRHQQHAPAPAAATDAGQCCVSDRSATTPMLAPPPGLRLQHAQAPHMSITSIGGKQSSASFPPCRHSHSSGAPSPPCTLYQPLPVWGTCSPATSAASLSVPPCEWSSCGAQSRLTAAPAAPAMQQQCMGQRGQDIGVRKLQLQCTCLLQATTLLKTGNACSPWHTTMLPSWLRVKPMSHVAQ